MLVEHSDGACAPNQAPQQAHPLAETQLTAYCCACNTAFYCSGFVGLSDHEPNHSWHTAG